MRILTVKKSSEFQVIGRDCAKFHAKGLLLLERKSPQKYLLDKEKGLNAQDFCRLGLTVSKKVGNAVARNLVKRRLRHAFREMCKENLVKNHHDYVIIAKKEIKDVDFTQVLRDLRFCITRIGKVKS